MDEVDRLYECFKCGVTTPESASIKRKSRRRRRELKNNSHSSNESPSPAVNFNGSTSTHLPPFSPVVFYGSPQGVPPKKPVSILRLLRQIHVDLKEQNEFRQPDKVWITFPRQDEAMRFTSNHDHTNIFCYQDHLTEKRRFLVTTYTEFWRRYVDMDPIFRHHYEVIREGSPCHLYFDLEFSRKTNGDYRDGDVMVDLFISVVFEVLIEKYDVHLTTDCVLELDSSTDVKFSRHLIIRIPGAGFKDNSHAGAFVSEVNSLISSRPNEKYGILFVDKDHAPESLNSPSQIFVDTSVYSRNRCFRLIFSSKAGKRSVLVPTGRFKCQGMTTKLTQEQLFMQSLVCNMDSDCHRLLICKPESDCIKTLLFDTETNKNHKVFRKSTVGEENMPLACPTDATPTYIIGRSPFPAIDAFLESITCIGTTQGIIRNWYWFSDYGLLVYNMLRNRFCERIGREHKSNHVLYVFDMRRGTYYQKCHDPDCRGYRSPLRHIPDDISLETGDWDCLLELGKCGIEGRHDCDDEGIVCGGNEKRDSRNGDGIDRNTEFIRFMDPREEEDGDEDYMWWTAVDAIASGSNL